MLGMAQEIDTLSEELGHAGGGPVFTTEQRTRRLERIMEQEKAVFRNAFAGGSNEAEAEGVPVPMAEVDVRSDRSEAGNKRGPRAGDKRVRMEASTEPQPITVRVGPRAGDKRVQMEASTEQQPITLRVNIVTAKRLDPRQQVEAEIFRATQANATGAYVVKDNGLKHPINLQNGFISEWPLGYIGCFACGADHRFKVCSRRNEADSKARFHANFAAHRPHHRKCGDGYEKSPGAMRNGCEKSPRFYM
jgi:hypothetical protein